MNYRGVRPATIIRILEGNGTEKNPYKNDDYVIQFEMINGIQRQITIGKITPLTEEEKKLFNK